MKKVLIVEDEILARMGLRQLIDWEAEGLLVLPDAKDGREAIEAIKRERPDIILLDLNIPVVNGLQILQYLKKQDIPSRTIVITCNEEFDVVKEAMKLGAYDYLRKLNLSSEELLSAIRKCREDSEKKQNDVSMKDKENKGFEELYYEEMITAEKTMFGGEKNFKSTMCVIQNEAGRENNYIIDEAIKKWLSERGMPGIHIIKNGQSGEFLFDKILNYELVSELQRGLDERFDGEVYIGVCQLPVRNISEFNVSLSLAEQIALKVYYDEEKRVEIFREKIPVQGHSPRGIQEIISELKKKIEGFRAAEAKRCINNIFSVVRSEKYIHINVLRRNFMDILGMYSMTARNIGGAIEEIELWGTNCHYQKLMNMSSLKQIEKWFVEFEDEFCSHFFVAYKCCNSETLKSIIDYIDEHIKEKVSLKDAAKDIGISGAYLSTFFKKEMGQNLTEYINVRKVQMAKEMLRSGKLVYEVSELVGFENVTYFSKVFKKYIGMSPDAFRKSNSEF